MRHLLLSLALIGMVCGVDSLASTHSSSSSTSCSISPMMLSALHSSHSEEYTLMNVLGVASAYAQDGLEELEEASDQTQTMKSAQKSGAQKSGAQKSGAQKSGAQKSGAQKSGAQKSGIRADKRLKVTSITKKRAQSRSSAQVYLQQIQRIESQINELKEEVFRSRTRLAILKESVLASGLSGTELRILHRNDMGANFKLERILYILDGSPIRQAVDRNGDLDRQEMIEILNGPISPGNHTLQVELIYRGNGFGVFSYLQSYRFTLNDVTTFRAEEGKRVTISAVGYERSGVTLELKDRPDIRFVRSVDDLEEEEEAKSTAKGSSDSSTSDSSASDSSSKRQR